MKTRSRIGPGWLRQVLLMLGCVLIGSCYGLIVRKPIASSGEDYERLQASRLLLTQQIDGLAASYLNALAPNALSQRDREALETWILFDTQYVDLNRSNPLQAFEVATALQRLGIAFMVSGKPKLARQFTAEAVEFFASLEREYPSSVSYRFDLADAHLQLADLAHVAGDLKTAREECQLAIDALQVEQTLATGEFDAAIPKLLDSAATLLVALGESERAAVISQKSSAIRQALSASSDANPETRKSGDAPKYQIQ